jgi:hypothetical protein
LRASAPSGDTSDEETSSEGTDTSPGASSNSSTYAGSDAAEESDGEGDNTYKLAGPLHNRSAGAGAALHEREHLTGLASRIGSLKMEDNAAASQQPFHAATPPLLPQLQRPPPPPHQQQIQRRKAGIPGNAAPNPDRGSVLQRQQVLGEPSRLLFEFFESDAPHQRTPLSDRIAELAKGFPGLAQLTTADLHPASWFAVAW